MKLFKSFNLIKLAVIFYIILFIFLSFYTFYRAEIIHNGIQFKYYFKHYVIFVVGIIFWISVLFLNYKKKFYIVVTGTFLLSLLYFHEIIRFYSPEILQLNIVKKFYNKKLAQSKIGKDSKYMVIENLKKKGIDAVPSVFPKAILKSDLINQDPKILPLGGVSNKTTVFCKEGDKFSIYKSDRYGFNNPNTEWDKKKIKWFLIGDSFTQGSCVQPGEDIASQIRLLSNDGVISLGMSGNGPLIELASLKEYSYIKKPEIVLWLYFERNDLEDLKYEKSNLILNNYLNNDYKQKLFSKQIIIDKKLGNFIKKEENKLHGRKLNKRQKKEKFINFKKIIRLKILRDKIALDRGFNYPIDPLFRNVLKNAKNFVKEWGGEIYFVYIPDKERYSNKNINDDFYLKRFEVLKLVSSLNIKIVDLHKDFFLNQKDPISFFAHRIYGHFSPEGYKEISNIIFKTVNSF